MASQNKILACFLWLGFCFFCSCFRDIYAFYLAYNVSQGNILSAAPSLTSYNCMLIEPKVFMSCDFHSDGLVIKMFLNYLDVCFCFMLVV